MRLSQKSQLQYAVIVETGNVNPAQFGSIFLIGVNYVPIATLNLKIEGES